MSTVSAQAPPTAAEAVAGTTVIPRSALFGNPEKTQARVSPDGKYVSFIAPKDGVLNVWVGPRSDPSAAKPVTSDTKRGIRQHFWAYDNQHVLYIQDEGGDENWHLYATDVVAGTTKDLTPYKGIQAQVAALTWKKPGSVAVGLNEALAILEGVEGVGVTRFSEKDVVRHPLVARIVAAYNRADKSSDKSSDKFSGKS